MKIKIYAHFSAEAMYEAGIKAGLDVKAANYFRCLEEIEIELHVDGENGAVCGAEILTKFD